jgi:3-oxoacyl-[acyl-carrier protein] reductase
VFLLSQQAARAMVAQGKGGVILSTASANGHVAEQGVAAYNASKAGVVLLTQTMAVELAPHGIRVNCVSPGYVGPTGLVVDGGGDPAFFDKMAEHVPLGRIGKAEEIANLFCFLASDEASFMSGESVIIDGAQLAEQR